MKNKKYYINEGRNFDISPELRDTITSKGFKFYKQYECTGICKYRKFIWLIDDNGVEVVLPYDKYVYVH